MIGNGLKLEKNWPIFSTFDATRSKIPQKFIMVIALSDLNSFDIFVVTLQKHFVYD